MKSTVRMSLTILLGLAGVMALGAFADTGEGASACERSATDMARSCGFETNEEFNATVANCRQLASRDARTACRQMARADRLEAYGDCREQRAARNDVCELLDENRYTDPLTDSTISFIDPDDIGDGGIANNPYVILQAGHTFVLKSEDETIVVHATSETRDILGVSCRVVVDIVVEEEYDDEEAQWDYTPIEVTDDWFAQDAYSNVYYCGEIARNFEEGVLRDLDGSFEAGVDFAKGGLLTLAMPAPGVVHRQEYSLGEAEDIVEYLALATSPEADEGGENPAFPCAGTCIKTLDSTALEPDASEFKYYLPGVGFVLAAGLEDGELTGEREELVCTGDSLDILEDDECDIEDPEALRDALCGLHVGFCEDN